MDVNDLLLFIAAGFAAALVAGLAGFAFGLVAASIWLHILTPLETTTLIVVFGFLVQGYAVWKLRGALRFDRLWPFIVGGIIGVPFGVELLRWIDPHHVRQAVGILLVAFTVYTLARPAVGTTTAGGRVADGGIGVLSGVIGGVTGLAGILPTAWCAFRGWPKDEQRAVFQPVGVVIFLATIAWLGSSGSISSDTSRLVLIGLPAVLLGVWSGMKLYGGLDEGAFRKLVLGLLFVSGAVLLIR
jgi:uncharacterized membrane protein YfcA